MENIEINSKSYRIIQQLKRTKGSNNQMLVDVGSGQKKGFAEHCSFYILEKDRNEYFAKFDSDVDCVYEYTIGKLVEKVKIENKNILVSPIEYIDANSDVVLSRYYKDHKKYSELRLAESEKEDIKKSLKLWVEKVIDSTAILDYDMSINNMIFNLNEGFIDVKMLDFAKASRSIKRSIIEIEKIIK